MPPKTKFSRSDIVEVAFSIVRQRGWGSLSARAIAEELHSSTMPIYFHFKSMEKLEGEIIKKSLELLLKYQTTPRTGDPVLDLGVGYVQFASEERHLFKGINDEKHGKLLRKHGEKNFHFLLESLSGDRRTSDLSLEQRRKLMFVQWIFIHGLANINNVIHLDNFSKIELAPFLEEVVGIFLKGFLADLKDSDQGMR